MFRKILQLPLVPFALVCVALVRLLARMGVLVRFGEFWSERIGHLAGNTETYLCEKQAGLQPKSFDIWFHRATPCNEQLGAMLNRAMFVDNSGFARLVMLCNVLFKGWEKYSVGSTQIDRDVHNLYEKQKPHLYLTAEEELEGWETMRQWGIPDGAKWVCLIVRDKAYLPMMSHHDYRDSDVETYVLACKELVERGYYVFRMGAKVAKPMPFMQNVFDYAVDGLRSELMDIYLGKHCEFCISNGTGFDAIPVIFRRPVVFVNYAPVEYLNTWVPSVAIWKHHYRGGKRMSFQEIIESGAGQFMATHLFAEEGITLVDNTAEEIRDAVLDFLEPTKDDEAQAKFWGEFPRAISPYNGRPLHGEVRMRIGAKFLESYVAATADSAPGY